MMYAQHIKKTKLMEKIRLNLQEIIFCISVTPIEVDSVIDGYKDDPRAANDRLEKLAEIHREEVVKPLIKKVFGKLDDSISFEKQLQMARCIIREQLDSEIFIDLIDGEEDKKLRFAMFESSHPNGVEVTLPDSERVERCKSCMVGLGGISVLEISITPIQITKQDAEELRRRLEDEDQDPLSVLMEIIGKHQEFPPEFRDITQDKGFNKAKKSGGLTDMFGVKPSEN